MSNGSFESGSTNWTLGSGAAVKSSGWNGVTAADGSKYLTVSGPADPGYSYLKLATQSKTSFPTGVPSDNFVVYLYAYTYLHTIDGRDVSYALTLQPGYGVGGGVFHGGAQDMWVTSQTWGYYSARDPYDATSAIKPMIVILELRDPLQAGEYLILDGVSLQYGGQGIPEPTPFAGLLTGIGALLIAKRRKNENAKSGRDGKLEKKQIVMLRGQGPEAGHNSSAGFGASQPKHRKEITFHCCLLPVAYYLIPFRPFAPSRFRDYIKVLFALIMLTCAGGVQAGITRHDVLVVYNSNSAASRAVASYYQMKRNIPASHVRSVTCGTVDAATPYEFVALRDQIKAILTSLGSSASSPADDPISTIVLATDIPHYVSDGAEAYGAVDSALAGCFTESTWGKEPIGTYGDYQAAPGFPNPYFGDYALPSPFEQFRSDPVASTSIEAFPSPGFTIIRMLDANTALAAGGGGILFRGVRLGGVWTWNPVRGKDKAFISWRVSFISVLDSLHAYACTGNPSRPHGGGTIIATADGGLTWSRIRYTSRLSGWKLKDAFVGVDFGDTQHGWAVGSSQSAYASAAPLMVRTLNGGSTWEDISAKLPASFFPRAVTAADVNNVWICGNSGAIYHSADGGYTWTLANSGAPTVDYTSIWIRLDGGACKGWAAGESGTIIRTEDGSTWTSQTKLSSSNITDFSAFGQDIACAAYGGTGFSLFNRAAGWKTETVGLASVTSAASAGIDDSVAVGGTRYIFADSAGGWTAAYSGSDTPWRLRYLITRLDGYSEDNNGDGIPDDIKAIIDRACAPASSGKWVLDEATNLDTGAITPNQFQPIRDALVPIVGSGQVVWDQTSVFLTGQTNVMGYTSWGLHDSSANTYTTFGRPLNSWVNGGIGVVRESTDGRSFATPYYMWGMYKGGTIYPGKLGIEGFWNQSKYSGYRAALMAANGTELAAGTLVGGKVQIDLSGISWPSDKNTYVQLFFPTNDPLHPSGIIDHARYPWSGANMDIYNGRTSGISFSMSLARNMLSEMLREGASGGTCNVDEPWANYIGQPVYLFPRYAQGYTWGETAYMGLPGIGWQEVVVGDPMMAPYATPPAVSITTPASDGVIVTGTMRVNATATPTNSSGIAKIEFWLDDDTLLSSDTAAPYFVDVNTAALADGVHEIEAVAFEDDAVQNIGSTIRTFVSNNRGLMLPKIGDALAKPDNTLVGLHGKVVSAAFNGMFYVEDSNRLRGIRVRSATVVQPGAVVTVVGKMATVAGEREIVADGVY